MNQCTGIIIEAGGNEDRNVVNLAELNGAGMNRLEPVGDHFQHFFIADFGEFPGLGE